MAPTTNEQIYDALIRRQVYVVRFSNQLSDDAIKLLKATDKDLEKLVLYYSRKLKGKPLTSAPARKILKAMKAEVSALRYSAWDGVSKSLEKELKAYAASEAEHVSKVIREALPVIVNTTPVPAAKVAEVIKHTAWEGATLAEHIHTAASADVGRIVKRVRIGAGRQQSLDEIVQSVMGSALQNYRDGAVSKAWHGAETLAYSATTSAQNEATTLVAEENPWLVTKEVFRATLDGRTTPICIKNSNKVFAVGKGPQPPLHYRCRSRRVPYIVDESLGPQAFDPSTEKTLVTEYAELNGLGKVGSRAALPYGTKGDFDAWARKRRRALIGQVPDTVNYSEWFAKQSAAFQDEELGAARGKIYRAGNLPLDRYINRKGKYYTLDELEARSNSATPTPRKRGGGSSGGGSATPAPKPKPKPKPKPPSTSFTDEDDALLNDLKSGTTEVNVSPAMVKVTGQPYRTKYNTGEDYPSREQMLDDYNAYERRKRAMRGEPPIVELISGRDDLTERQTTLIKQYQGTAYKTHNKVLRHRADYDEETVKQSEQFVADIEDSIGKYALKDDVVLYRGVKHSGLYTAFDENSIGKTMQASSLQSTTWDEDTARGFAKFSGGFLPSDKKSVLMNINVKSGTHALYVADITGSLRSEKEFLLSSKGQYVVRDVKTEKYRSWDFHYGVKVGKDIEYKIIEVDYVEP